MSRQHDELARRCLDLRNPPPGHSAFHEPDMSASEWRAAYFALARIAIEQLNECRGRFAMTSHWPADGSGDEFDGGYDPTTEEFVYQRLPGEEYSRPQADGKAINVRAAAEVPDGLRDALFAVIDQWIGVGPAELTARIVEDAAVRAALGVGEL